MTSYRYRAACVAAAVMILLVRESASQLSVCGRPPLNSRIVGGQVAPAGSWPWQVSLHRGSHFCGASLINSEWLLSAAHCFESVSAGQLTAYMGRQTQTGSNPNQVSRGVSQIISHPDYDSSSSDNDIALLRLSSAVSFTDYIVPVCLAAADSSVHSGEDTWVTGWGTLSEDGSLSNNLMEVEVPIEGNRQCNCDYGVGRITDNMLCAGLREGGRDACQGDSGGPLVIKQGDLWVELGVVSFGIGCARAELPGVYARVSRYRSWIDSHITANRPGYVTVTSTGTDGDLSVTCPGLAPAPTAGPAAAATTAATTAPPTTTPAPLVCGQAPLNTRLQGAGSVASAGTWPWMASLQRNGNHVCGGTLVAEDFVLSDASCFSSSSQASDWTVVLGRLQQSGSNPFEVTVGVLSITQSSLSGNNVALLKLSSPPTLSDYIRPICLDDGRAFAEGAACWAAGWSAGRGGDAQVLQEIQTSVQSCGNVSSADLICTSNFTLEQGDLGGPLMCQLGGSWFQAATLTNSTGRSRAASRNVFDRLNRYQSFLRETLGTFLSPAASGGAALRSASLVSIFVHLLVLAASLHLFL